MQTWTIDELLSHSPCEDYPRARLEEMWAGRERLSVLDILELDIPAEDRVWAALQAGDHVAPAVERIVTRAVTNHCLSCGIHEVESWARDWLNGEQESIAAAVRAAVKTEALAAGLAVLAAARAAGSAVLAAGSAVLAARMAAGSAGAEREQQVADIRAVLTEAD